MIRFLLMDVEGTTSSIHFVHRVLFPYAAQHLSDFIHREKDNPAVQAELARVGEGLALEETIGLLLQWIREDKKHPALKNLQGMIWKAGYESGAFQGHVYPDVKPAWERWTSQGLRLGIYSSGSVEAQQLIFGYSEAGDLRGYLSSYFDTAVGQKREPASYREIARLLDLPPDEILFLSDVEAELDAAREAGLQTILVCREDVPENPGHPVIQQFSQFVPPLPPEGRIS